MRARVDRFHHAIAFVAALTPMAACTLFTDLEGLSGGGESDDSGVTGDASGGGDALARDGAVVDAAPCTKAKVGGNCTFNSHCCSNSCYFNKCEGNDVGSKCATDDKCITKSCYFNVCQSTEIGSQCASNSNCVTNNCYFNRCEGNGPGSKCFSDAKCTSMNCFNNVCQ